MKKDKSLNKFLIKLIITTSWRLCDKLDPTLENWQNITSYQNLVELPHFALQHRSSYSATLP